MEVILHDKVKQYTKGIEISVLNIEVSRSWLEKFHLVIQKQYPHLGWSPTCFDFMRDNQ